MHTPRPCKSLLAATAFALAAWTAPALAHDTSQASTVELAAAQKKANTTKPSGRVRASVPHQIACTRTGCHPIPRNCRSEIEYDFRGNPTGFNVVVCD